MNKTFCGADCSQCPTKDECKGCIETNGCPFGGRCAAAEYIKIAGREKYNEFKQELLSEINFLLEANDIPKADSLFELCGQYVNLEYTLPGGEKIRFLNDKNIYLGSQIEFADMGICYGVVADTNFILICSYSVDGSEPELIVYKKR